MTDIITTKDLTKNELSTAKILATFAILAGLVVFLNSAQMEQKDLPEIVFNAIPVQIFDGSGLVNFGANISKLTNYQSKLKLEYALDGENYQPLNLAQAEIDTGSLTMAPDQEYQISDIVSDSDSANLNFAWDSKAGQQDISSDRIKIRITLAARLKESENLGGGETDPPAEPDEDDANLNINSEENPLIEDNVEIDEAETILGPEVIIETNEPAPAENNEENIIGETINNILETITPDAEAAMLNETDEEGWSQVIAISDKFSLDNVAPQIRSAEINWAKGQIYVYFNEAIINDPLITNDQILLQNEVLLESTIEWKNSLTLIISLSLIEQEKYKALLDNWALQIISNENIKDAANNIFPGALVILAEQDENQMEDEEEKPEEKKEDEKIIIPQDNKIINMRGYNKNCNFNPDDFVMAAGETRQTSMSLVARDADSKFMITSTSVPNGFEVKILQPTGTGNGPITISVTAPADAASRLYKILLRYEDFTPQSISYVNNCVLRLNVE